MSSNFGISVQISGQKYEICIAVNKTFIDFSEIYPKLQEVVKIGANEDIDFKSHDFEVCVQNMSPMLLIC